MTDVYLVELYHHDRWWTLRAVERTLDGIKEHCKRFSDPVRFAPLRGQLLSDRNKVVVNRQSIFSIGSKL